MDKSSRIYIAGHRGLVGSALLRKLRSERYENLVLRTSGELDLREQAAVREFFRTERPEYVFLAAARVGGIHANNSFPAQFIYENLMIEANIIHSSYLSGVKKLLFLGSSCIYPKFAPQPIKENSLLEGKLEPTNQAYAIAKIAGIEMCRSYNTQYGTGYISLMPTNLYGPGDNFDLENAHVLPALIRKFVEAGRENRPDVTVWGTGSPMREFLYVDDLADASLFLMKNYSGSGPVNIGTGRDISIRDLALMVKKITGFQGGIVFDNSKPDGTPRKLLDVSLLNSMGWQAMTGLEEGIRLTYEWYMQNRPGK